MMPSIAIPDENCPPNHPHTVAEAARRINCGQTKAWQEIWNGALAHIRIGRKTLVLERHITEYLASKEVKALTPHQIAERARLRKKSALARRLERESRGAE